MIESNILGTLTVEAIILGISSTLLWMKTGKDPLYWTAQWSIQLRAALIQAGLTAKSALAHFKANYPEALWQVKEEIKHSGIS